MAITEQRAKQLVAESSALCKAFEWKADVERRMQMLREFARARPDHTEWNVFLRIGVGGVRDETVRLPLDLVRQALMREWHQACRKVRELGGVAQ